MNPERIPLYCFLLLLAALVWQIYLEVRAMEDGYKTANAHPIRHSVIAIGSLVIVVAALWLF